MAEVAGKTNVVYVHTEAMTNSTGAKITGADNASYKTLCDILDITSFGDTNRKRMAGLLDTEITVSGNIYTGDTGQGLLVPGTTVFIGCYPQGTAVPSMQVQAIVNSFEASYPVDGKQTFSATFSCIAAPVALPAQT